ncbi:hypothetical protein Micbo1qcDRAFT_10019 [Microdochium bolleyi]|uniref:Uncharacterized protein n=1 Tax=Microdochium bolleyi TaxID=196109 RepID=A0A136IY42_9PEZI|nr:hypothetical protein Micbo1qcDRAFT_10019 [Microdochium bolleyi]
MDFPDVAEQTDPTGRDAESQDWISPLTLPQEVHNMGWMSVCVRSLDGGGDLGHADGADRPGGAAPPGKMGCRTWLSWGRGHRLHSTCPRVVCGGSSCTTTPCLGLLSRCQLRLLGRMIQGGSSLAGRSFVVGALPRSYHKQHVMLAMLAMLQRQRPSCSCLLFTSAAPRADAAIPAWGKAV